MNADIDKNQKYFKYNHYWQNSLEKIEDIAKNLENNLFNLEKKYLDFENIYRAITCQINTLSSIYSSYNNLKGKEYLLKLKAVFENYKRRYTRDGIDFNSIHFLHSKINELRQNSFDDFPRFEHLYNDYNIQNFTECEEIKNKIINEAKLRVNASFKWITFFRNGSWFIAPFHKLQIVDFDDAVKTEGEDNILYTQVNDSLIKVEDIFLKFQTSRKEKIQYFIITENNNSIKSFAAAKLGKTIYSRNNFIIQRLKSFKKKSSISRGRVRIFGSYHIYL